MRGDTGAGEEEAHRRKTGGQELETRLPLGPVGTGPQVEAGKGGSGSRNIRRMTEPIREKPQGLTGELESCQGRRKGSNRMGDKAAETRSQRGAAGDNRDLGSSSREARQQVQRREMEAGGIIPFSRWTGGPRPGEGGESVSKSGVDHS